jgi:hypothetical protein
MPHRDAIQIHDGRCAKGRACWSHAACSRGPRSPMALMTGNAGPTRAGLTRAGLTRAALTRAGLAVRAAVLRRHSWGNSNVATRERAGTGRTTALLASYVPPRSRCAVGYGRLQRRSLGRLRSRLRREGWKTAAQAPGGTVENASVANAATPVSPRVLASNTEGLGARGGFAFRGELLKTIRIGRFGGLG